MSGIKEDLPFIPVNIALVTISDSRDEGQDTSGALLAELAGGAGHNITGKTIIADDKKKIVAHLKKCIADPGIDVVISSGGTGVTGRDVTPEAFAEVMEKEISGFGELFRMLSYATIGTSAIQSRAIGGVAGGTYLFALPGSPGACRDGWEQILSLQLDSRLRPCNLVDLIPRLMES